LLFRRAWKAGYQVGLYATAFVRDVGMGGMRLFNPDKMGPQSRKNWRIIYDRYAKDIANGYFAARVAEASNIPLVKDSQSHKRATSNQVTVQRKEAAATASR
jgi:hypothetical protein